MQVQKVVSSALSGSVDTQPFSARVPPPRGRPLLPQLLRPVKLGSGASTACPVTTPNSFSSSVEKKANIWISPENDCRTFGSQRSPQLGPVVRDRQLAGPRVVFQIKVGTLDGNQFRAIGDDNLNLVKAQDGRARIDPNVVQKPARN